MSTSDDVSARQWTLNPTRPGSSWRFKLWVAGGLTKGGASEAAIKAIPREELMKLLAAGAIKQKKEVYPETRDNIE